jgi:hypothetical protein
VINIVFMNYLVWTQSTGNFPFSCLVSCPVPSLFAGALASISLFLWLTLIV